MAQVSDAAVPSDPDRPPDELDELLRLVDAGDRDAAERLAAAVHETLRGMARHAMGSAKNGHTLQPTALVNEAWLRMFGGQQVRWNGREHFLRVAAIAMRHVLIDHARKTRAGKRVPEDRLVDLDAALLAFEAKSPCDLIDLDDALRDLEAQDPVLAQFATLRFFGGRTIEEAAALLGMKGTSGIAAWRTTKAWLKQRLAS